MQKLAGATNFVLELRHCRVVANALHQKDNFVPVLLNLALAVRTHVIHVLLGLVKRVHKFALTRKYVVVQFRVGNVFVASNRELYFVVHLVWRHHGDSRGFREEANKE